MEPTQQTVVKTIKSYPPESTVTKLTSTLPIKQVWLYSEWDPNCQFSRYIQPFFPDRSALTPTNLSPDVGLIQSVFENVRGKYLLWQSPKEEARWKKVETSTLTLDWVRENVEVLYPAQARFPISELNGIVLWKESGSGGKKYKLLEGNHRISAWLAAQIPFSLPAVIFIGKPKKQI